MEKTGEEHMAQEGGGEVTTQWPSSFAPTSVAEAVLLIVVVILLVVVLLLPR